MLNKFETLRYAQEILISSLDHIDNICKNNNISYWIDSGTLLGAYRDGSFIPWDEDIDLCMTRENYDKFLSVVYEQLDNEKYTLQNINTDKYYTLFPVPSKIRVNNTRILWTDQKGIQYKYSEKSHSGIYIDIFPMDNFLESKRTTRNFIIRLYKILYLKRHNNLSTIKKIISNISKYFINRKLIDKINKYYYENINKKNTEYLDYSCDMALQEYKFPKNIIFPLKEIVFEGKKYPCPNKTKEYLILLYGNNFMTPPNNPYQHGKITKLYDKEYE
ncbi:LicD family protein [Proteus mirabilis]|uniref:LicD family protein n=1 Tax=Proteus mirabilis TaxID=584 RepID=UPI0035528CFF